jgi:hypothetical protein
MLSWSCSYIWCVWLGSQAIFWLGSVTFVLFGFQARRAHRRQGGRAAPPCRRQDGLVLSHAAARASVLCSLPPPGWARAAPRGRQAGHAAPSRCRGGRTLLQMRPCSSMLRSQMRCVLHGVTAQQPLLQDLCELLRCLLLLLSPTNCSTQCLKRVILSKHGGGDYI